MQIAAAISLAVQKLENLIAIVTLVHESEVGCGHTSVAVDDKRCRQRLDAAVQVSDGIVPEGNAIVDPFLFDVGLYGVPSILVHGDAQNGKPAIFVLLLKLHEPRDLNLARPAP